jgi:hypothetical protein
MIIVILDILFLFSLHLDFDEGSILNAFPIFDIIGVITLYPIGQQT